MSESLDTLFDQGLEKYQAGEKAENLIPTFQEVCDRDPKNSAAWTCLAWLYMLVDQPQKALKAANKSVKLEPRDPQAQVNLALAMLGAGEKGVRKHIDIVQQAIRFDDRIRDTIKENIDEGLTRKPDWNSLQRVNKWLFG
ncbi:MAG: tetratricopeptide repeat protein [Cyanobacteria bacterium P01_F01_bin.143]